MSEPQQEVFEEELTLCPDCKAPVVIESMGIESNGEGVAFATIRCIDCDFEARETWVHDTTERMEE